MSTPARERLVADAVAAALNGNAWTATTDAWTPPDPIGATRVYIAKRELKDYPPSNQPPLVSVRIADSKRDPFSRSTSKFDFSIDIDTQQRVDPADNAEGDAVLDLAEQFADYFDPTKGRGRQLVVSGVGTCQCMLIEKPAIYSPDHLDQYRLMLAVVRLNFVFAG